MNLARQYCGDAALASSWLCFFCETSFTVCMCHFLSIRINQQQKTDHLLWLACVCVHTGHSGCKFCAQIDALFFSFRPNSNKNSLTANRANFYVFLWFFAMRPNWSFVVFAIFNGQLPFLLPINLQSKMTEFTHRKCQIIGLTESPFFLSSVFNWIMWNGIIHTLQESVTKSKFIPYFWCYICFFRQINESFRKLIYS